LPTILELTMAAIGIEHVAAGKSFYAWLEVAFKILKPSDEVFRTPIPKELKEGILLIIYIYLVFQ